MSMFTHMPLTGVNVTESNGKVTVSGFKIKAFHADLEKQWGTSILAKEIFSDSNMFRSTFHSFFALEFKFILITLLENTSKHKFKTPKRHLLALLQGIDTKTWVSNTLHEPEPYYDYSKLDQFDWSPLKHQLEFIKDYERRTLQYQLNGMLLDAAPGAGKTLNTLFLSALIGAKQTIIVCPKKTVDEVWIKTIESRYKRVPKYWAAAYTEKPNDEDSIYIVHYEALERLLDIVKRDNITKPFIIIDECHNLNEMKSARTQTLLKIAKVTQCKDIVWASGTPLKAMGSEIVPLLTTIDKYFNSHVAEVFMRIFGKRTLRAKDIFAHRLGRAKFNVTEEEFKRNAGSTTTLTQEDIKISIPNGSDFTLESIKLEMRKFLEERIEYYKEHGEAIRTRFYELLEWYELNVLTPSGMKDYRLYLSYVKTISSGYDPILHKTQAAYCNAYEKQAIMPNLSNEDRKEFRDAKSVVKYLHLKIQGEVLGRIVGGKRLECSLDMIDHIDFKSIIDGSTKKTVIFSSYIEVANKTAMRLKELGYDPVTYHSQTKSSLKEAVKAFQDEPNTNPLVTTFMSLSEGVPLVEASTGILLNAPMRDHVRIQTTRRLDRIGQDSDVTFYTTYLDTDDKANISTRSKELMDWSKQQVAEMMGREVDDMELDLEDKVDPEMPPEGHGTWKEIPEYSSHMASTKGYIFNKDTGHVTLGGVSGRYRRVSVKKDNSRKASLEYVHILVCSAFHKVDPKKPVVLHKNNNRLDCRSSNLKWGTQSENIKQVYVDGLLPCKDMESKSEYPRLYHLSIRNDLEGSWDSLTMEDTSHLVVTPSIAQCFYGSYDRFKEIIHKAGKQSITLHLYVVTDTVGQVMTPQELTSKEWNPVAYYTDEYRPLGKVELKSIGTVTFSNKDIGKKIWVHPYDDVNVDKVFLAPTLTSFKYVGTEDDMEAKAQPEEVQWDANFGPEYTPMEMLDLGIFEGIYTHAIKGIPKRYTDHPKVLGKDGPDDTINKFGVKSRQSLKVWQENKWVTEASPLGWWEWYVKYYEGRRLPEDAWQIGRWNSFVARHQGQIVKAGVLTQVNERRKQRQGLLQWGWDSTIEYSQAKILRNAKRHAKRLKLTLKVNL